jgi:hypothetical protein
MAAARWYFLFGIFGDTSFDAFHGGNQFVQTFDGNVAIGSGESVGFEDSFGASKLIELPLEFDFSGHTSALLMERGSWCASSMDFRRTETLDVDWPLFNRTNSLTTLSANDTSFTEAHFFSLSKS